MTDHLIACASIGFIAGSLIGALREPWLKWRYQRRYRRSFNHENTNRPGGPPPLKLRRKDGPPALGMRRVYYDMPSTIAECGGPCAAGPEHCDCGALWRDVPKRPRDLLVFGEPVRLDPGSVQRGNGNGGPTTPKPPIKPTTQDGRLIRIDQEPPPPTDP